MLRRLSATVMATLGSLAIAAQIPAQAQDFSQVEIETIPVRENIYLLHGEGGNIGLFVEEDGTFTADFDTDWGGGFLAPEQFQTIVYLSVAEDAL